MVRFSNKQSNQDKLKVCTKVNKKLCKKKARKLAKK